MRLAVTVNGTEYAREVEPRLLLIHFLRDELGLTGSHWGCDTSNCGACVVWLDETPVKSCTLLAVMAAGKRIKTVEGLGTAGKLDPVQQGFAECHGLQCGFCTPGMMMTARWLLDRNPEPTETEIREAISAGRSAAAPAMRTSCGPYCGQAGTPVRRPMHDQHAYGSVPRKEDARFIRGRGSYVDDITMPGMLHGAILRSPVAHARISSVDVTAARAHPRVEAVITGADLAVQGLAWMPTMSADVQAVLATDKVRFQGQEVAFVIAQDRYAARDALELILVEYEPLTPVIDARTALDPGAPVVRDDLAGRADNRVFDWTAGDQPADDALFATADVVVGGDMIYPRSHPAPLETCGVVADWDAVAGKLTLWSTSQAPHAHRTLYAMITGLPEHKIRVVSPDLGGGFGNKVPVYPGYLCAIAGAMLTGRPVKWVEDRSENLMSTSFARDYHMHGEIAATRDGKILGLRAAVLADHGAFNATAQPAKFPAGFSTSSPARMTCRPRSAR